MARMTRVRMANMKRKVETRRILPTEELKSKMRPGRKLPPRATNPRRKRSED